MGSPRAFGRAGRCYSSFTRILAIALIVGHHRLLLLMAVRQRLEIRSRILPMVPGYNLLRLRGRLPA